MTERPYPGYHPSYLDKHGKSFREIPIIPSPGAQMETLLQLATEINLGFKSIKTTYVQLGGLLITARKRVKSETTYSWPEWCKNYLRKADGKPFSQKTIENYIYLAGNPDRVQSQRRMQRDNIANIRKRALGVDTADAMVSLFNKTKTTNEQVNILMTAWEYSSTEAQEQFLEMIGARL